MRFNIWLLISTLLAVAHVAYAQPAEYDDSRLSCDLPGQQCDKLKRAPNAAAEALPQPDAAAGPDAEPFRRYCHLPGQVCAKAKRSSIALDEAIAGADAATATGAQAHDEP